MTKTIAEVAESLGYSLLPWQQEAAKDIEAGRLVTWMPEGRRAGRATWRRILRAWKEQG